MPRKTVVTKEEFEAGEDPEAVLAAASEEAQIQESPLFDAVDLESKLITKVVVRRTEPESGFMGTMPPDVNESRILAKWGGGEYRLEAKNQANRIVRVRTCKLAGDPIFNSEAEERAWRKLNGLPMREDGKKEDAVSMKDMLLMMEEREERRRAEQLEREERTQKENAVREERDRKGRDDREVQLQRDRDTREDRARKDNDEREERRRREAREDDERTARLHREDMERIQTQAAMQLQQTQAFFTQLAATLKTENQADPVQTLLAGMQVAREMGSGEKAEPGDFLSQLMGRLPETLAEIRKTGAMAYGEITNRKAGRPAGVGKNDDFLTITGPTATRAKTVLAKLAKEGKNPEAVINQLLTMAGGGARPATAKPAAGGKVAVNGKRRGRGPGRKFEATASATGAVHPPRRRRGNKSGGNAGRDVVAGGNHAAQGDHQPSPVPSPGVPPESSAPAGVA